MNSTKSSSDFSLSIEEMIAYLKNTCSDKERKRIKSIIDDSPLYQSAIHELEIMLQEDEGQLEEVLSLKNTMDKHLDSFSQDISKTITSNNHHQRSIYFNNNINLKLAAAITLLIIASGLIIYWLTKPPKEIRLAQEFLTHYEDPLAQLSGTEDLAILYYSQHEYAKAIPVLEKLISRTNSSISNQNNRFRMFLGVSLLHEKRIPEAIPHFLKIIDHNDNIYISPAQWYLAIAYLAKEDSASAKSWLEKLLNSNKKDKASLQYKIRGRKLLDKL